MVVCYFHGKNCFVSIIGGQCFYGSSEPNVKKMVMHGSLRGRIMLTNDMPTSAEKYQTVRHYIICLLIKKKYSCTNTPKQCYMHIYTHKRWRYILILSIDSYNWLGKYQTSPTIDSIWTLKKVYFCVIFKFKPKNKTNKKHIWLDVL